MKIHCPECKQEYEITEEYIGKEAECEKCKHSFVVANPNLIKCPTCHKEISKNATNCIHCGDPLSMATKKGEEQWKPTKIKEKGDIICPNPRCGYIGKPQKIARGDMGIGCLLCLFFLLPGLLYFMFKSGYIYKCPQCGTQISSDF